MKSRRLPFFLCLASLAAATALLCVGTHISIWIVGRILQGASAGFLWVVCLALLSDTVGMAGIGRAVGIIGIPMSMGPIIGPLIGGVLYAYGGYYSVFALMFSFLAVDAILRMLIVEQREAQKWLEVEPEECRHRGAHASAEPENLSGKASSPAPSGGHDAKARQATETGATRPMRTRYSRLPTMLRLLLSFRIFIGVIGGLLQSALNVAFDSTLPLVVNSLFGWEQMGQGLIFVTILAPSLLQPVFGAITDRYQQGRRLSAAVGLLLATPAYVLLGQVTHDTLSQKVTLCTLLVIIGLAMAIAMPAIIAEIGAAVSDIRETDPEVARKGIMATGWSLVNAAYAAGCLLGPLFSGLICNASNWQTMAWSLGLLSGTTGVFLLLFLGGWIGNIERTAFLARVAR